MLGAGGSGRPRRPRRSGGFPPFVEQGKGRLPEGLPGANHLEFVLYRSSPARAPDRDCDTPVHLCGAPGDQFRPTDFMETPGRTKAVRSAPGNAPLGWVVTREP